MNHLIELAEGDTVTVSRKAASPPVVPVEPVPTERRPIGFNLEGNEDWQRSAYYIDIMRSARPIATNVFRVLTGTDHLAKVDGLAHGSLQNKNFVGTYTLQYSGTGTITASGAAISGRTLIVSQVGNVDLTVPSTITGLKVLRPGYTSDIQIFTTEFLNDMKHATALRFMNWTNTNSENGFRTMPMSSIVEMCNATKCAPWICVKHNASAADCYSDIATLGALDSSLPIYLEYSNEIWNGIFEQGAAVQAAATAYTGTPSLEPAMNQWYKTRHYAFKRLCDIAAQFKVAFGARVRPVFADQYASPALVADTLSWANKVGLPMPYAIACAPYYGPSDTSNVDAAIASLRSTLDKRDAVTSELVQWGSIARAYGIKLLGYEGGIDSGQGMVNLNVRIALAYDPRMKEITRRYLDQCYSQMDFLCYFWYCSTNSQSGSWGLKDNSAGATPKWDAAVEFTKLPAINGGLTCEFFAKTDFTQPVGTRVQPLNQCYWNWRTGGAYPRKDTEGLECRAFSMRATGKYISKTSGLIKLVPECDVTDRATITPATISAVAGQSVAVQIDYVGDTSGVGTATLRLMQEIGGVRTMVGPEQLTP